MRWRKQRHRRTLHWYFPRWLCRREKGVVGRRRTIAYTQSGSVSGGRWDPARSVLEVPERPDPTLRPRSSLLPYSLRKHLGPTHRPLVRRP
ncbi:hypothetical protein BHE74_00031687 [Ensete ventricosum]|nr:hypothetical protein GW17_00001567 [Ensete ventricosum]RWW61262.1 hypothetical protein BHE74_00031687 [Ensete ventricosum]RZS08125.1 hypothetical protein BHM03_00039060 [Ensete ventricosum]